MGTRKRWPFAASEVKGELVVSTRSGTCLQTNFKPAIAQQRAGKQPASTRIWNPLQMPSTRPPSAANFSTCSASRAKTWRWRRSADSRRRKNRREESRHRRRRALEASCQMNSACLPQILRDRVPSIVVAIAAGKHDDAKFHRDDFIISGHLMTRSSPAASVNARKSRSRVMRGIPRSMQLWTIKASPRRALRRLANTLARNIPALSQ